MRRLLLDTHIWLWYIAGSADLPESLQSVLDEAEGTRWLSPISVWEAGLLVRKERVRLDVKFVDWLERAFESVPIREAPMNLEVAKTTGTLRLPHADPADHFLAATALVYDLTLVTLDRHLVAAEWLPTLTQ